MTMTQYINPSSFRADPLGWGGNVAGHILIPLLFCYYVAVIGFLLMGEYPDKRVMFGVLAVMYLALEAPQNGTFADTIDDIVIVVLYGAGIALWGFVEVEIGNPSLMFEPIEALPLVLMFTLHLALGMGIRFWQMIESNRCKSDH